MLQKCTKSSLAVIALKLREALNLKDVNDLPLSFNVAWYEQKAVAVLLALLSLGFKNIRLGPTMPEFLSKNVQELIVKKYNVKTITNDPDADISAMMLGN